MLVPVSWDVKLRRGDDMVVNLRKRKSEKDSLVLERIGLLRVEPPARTLGSQLRSAQDSLRLQHKSTNRTVGGGVISYLTFGHSFCDPGDD